MAKRGLALSLQDGAVTLVFVVLGILMSDNEGIQKGLNLKGYGGLKPCIRCYNVWQKGKAPDGDTDVDITCSDDSRFVPMLRSTFDECVAVLRGAAARVLSGEMFKARLLELQKACGINWAPDGVLFDDALTREINILDIIRTDWMHGEISNGALTTEVHDFLGVAKRERGLEWPWWRQVVVSLRTHAHPSV